MLQTKANKDKHRPQPTGLTELHYHAKHNNYGRLESLLKKGKNPDIKNTDGYTPLCFAITQGHVEIISLLLKYKADPFLCIEVLKKALINILKTHLDYEKASKILKSLKGTKIHFDVEYSMILIREAASKWQAEIVVDALLELDPYFIEETDIDGHTILDYLNKYLDYVVEHLEALENRFQSLKDSETQENSTNTQKEIKDRMIEYRKIEITGSEITVIIKRLEQQAKLQPHFHNSNEHPPQSFGNR